MTNLTGLDLAAVRAAIDTCEELQVVAAQRRHELSVAQEEAASARATAARGRDADMAAANASYAQAELKARQKRDDAVARAKETFDATAAGLSSVLDTKEQAAAAAEAALDAHLKANPGLVALLPQKPSIGATRL